MVHDTCVPSQNGGHVPQRHARRAVLIGATNLLLTVSPALAEEIRPAQHAGSLLHVIGPEQRPPWLRAEDVTVDDEVRPLAVRSGWFFAPPQDVVGFAVLDDPSGAPMATSFAAVGGHDGLGVPVSRPFVTADDWIGQLFTYGVLRWRPGDPRATVLASCELLHQIGLDPILAESGVAPGVPFAQSASDARTRLLWITDDTIVDAYFRLVGPTRTTGEWGQTRLHEVLGLPTSGVVETAGWRRQRFERGILEYAIDAPEPKARLASTGLILRRATSYPVDALVPDRLVGGQVVIRGPAPIVPWTFDLSQDPRSTVPQSSSLARPTPIRVPPDQPGSNPSVGIQGATPTTVIRSGVLPGTTVTAGSRVPGAQITIQTVVAKGSTEQVVLWNEGTSPQDLTGWAFRSSTASMKYVIPSSTVIMPGGTVTAVSGRDAPSNSAGTQITLARRSLWRDGGGVVILFDREGIEVTRRTYP